MAALRVLLLATALATTLLACDAEIPEPSAAGAETVVEEIDAPAAAGSGEPALAVGEGGRVYLSWIEPEGDGHALRFATRTGGAWSEPRTIARGEHWFVNWADFPSILELPDGALAAHWLAKSGPGTYAYDVLVARSADGGETWSDPVVPHRDGTETEHGFVSMFPAEDGGLGLVWLDGREYAGREPGDPGAEMTLRAARIAAGAVEDEALLDGRVCDCCQTDVAIAAEGPVVAYRDRSPEEIRDISVVRLVGGAWSDPARIHPDDWEIAACPVNGPAIAARGERVAVAWYTAARDTLRVRLARSTDAGATFGEPVGIDAGAPEGRVDVALLESGEALVSWLERAEDGNGLILARRVGSDGRLGEPVTVARTSYARASGFPRMALSGDEAVFAWTDPVEPSRVRTATARLAAIPSPD
ncbi:MAG: glycoside hydrolase [Gemmatimonadetes bacterium]|nr:glycoside hydrolase [Gemmatimonadota bacterium]